MDVASGWEVATAACVQYTGERRDEKWSVGGAGIDFTSSLLALPLDSVVVGGNHMVGGQIKLFVESVNFYYLLLIPTVRLLSNELDPFCMLQAATCCLLRRCCFFLCDVNHSFVQLRRPTAHRPPKSIHLPCTKKQQIRKRWATTMINHRRSVPKNEK